MSILRLSSDHAYDWSDRSIKQGVIGVAQAPPDAAAATPAAGCGSAWLSDRALQALRQARLQVRQRSRSRPEVLPIGELSWRATADGLRAAGRRGCDPGAGRQLPHSADGPRGDLRDQPRAFAAPRGAVRPGGERSAPAAHRTDRHCRRRAALRQHGRGVAQRRTALTCIRRGGR